MATATSEHSEHKVIEDHGIEESKVSETVRPSVIEAHGYTLGRIIGRGSYAVVKFAASERHQESVAIKIVSKYEAPADYLTRFIPREIEVVKDLRHPNLIKFLQAVETTHRVYIVMEYAENGSLLEVIRRDTYIEEEPRAKYWFFQLSDAIAYCHSQGVVHRDIKCENILFDSNFDLKVSDFGFARGHMKPQSNGSPILSKTFCGSYAYASPEILEGIPYEPQMSDAWSMGVVLFAMVFGRLPYDDSNYSKLIKQVKSRVKFPQTPEVSEQCKTLILRLLSPLKFRLRVPQVLENPWMVQSR